MRIALVNPVARRCQGYHTIGSKLPQLGLQVLCQATPDDHSVDIIDEIFGADMTEQSLTRENYDLVGITTYSSGASRAYEIADHCRKQGIPTIMGGPHAWAMPDEVLQHVDSVAVGECDEIWPTIIEDAAAGRLEKRYEGSFVDLTVKDRGKAAQHHQPLNGRYDVASIQTSRGCPVGCDYCSVTRFNGPRIRRRPIDEIIEEWNTAPQRFIFVVDDNFFGTSSKHAEWSKELLRAIIKHGKKRLWFSQTTINMGQDPEGLELAYRAGCRGMLIGFETFNPDALKAYRKGINSKGLSQYKECIDNFHKAGIGVFGAFIIGGDEDTEDTVAETAVQSVKLGIDIIQITNLTPLPGTRMFDHWQEEGRIFATNYPQDWERYTFVETVYHPRKMSANKLDETIYELRHAAALRPWVWRRTLQSFWRTKSLTTAIFVHGMNKGFKRMARIQLQKDQERFGFQPRKNGRTRKIDDAFTRSLAKYASVLGENNQTPANAK